MNRLVIVCGKTSPPRRWWRTTLDMLSRKSDTAAAIYPLIGTAKRNGADPEACLRHMLTHIADHRVNQVDDFLP